MAQPLIIPSPENTAALAFPATVGGGNAIPFHNWVTAKGPNGYPNYIQAITAHYEIQVDTDGSASVDAPDWWRWLGPVTLVQADGVKRINEMYGDQLRVALEEFAGVECLKEHPDIAVSQTNASRKLSFRLPMTSKLLYEPDDDELMVDNFARIDIRPPDLSAAGVAIAGGTITLDSMTIRLEAEVVERDYIKWTSPLEFVGIPFVGAAELQTPVLDCRVMGLTLHKRAAAGGASLSNLTKVHLPGIFTEALKRDPDLLEQFAAHRRISTGTAATDQGVYRVSSIFATGRACPVLWAHEGEKGWSGDVVGQMTIKVEESSAITDKVALFRKRLPRNVQTHKALAKKYNKGKPLPFRVNTRNKTMRDPNKWPERLRDYLPLKCPVPGKPGFKAG